MMSLQSECRGPLESQGESRNNKRNILLHDGDSNANLIQPQNGDVGERGESTDPGFLPALVSQREEPQDKIIIWGTDSQCDDPDLAEFEMLECQELEAYLVEEEHDYGKLAVGKRGQLSDKTSCSHNTIVEEKVSCSSEGNASEWGQDATLSHSSGSNVRKVCLGTAELSSENDVFVTCVSSISTNGVHCTSTMDITPEAQASDVTHTLTEAYKTLSEDLTLDSQTHPLTSAKNTFQAHTESFDHNLNSTVLLSDGGQGAQKLKRSPSVEGGSVLQTNTTEECTHDLENTEADLSLHQEHLLGVEGCLNGFKFKDGDSGSAKAHGDVIKRSRRKRFSKNPPNKDQQSQVGHLTDPESEAQSHRSRSSQKNGFCKNYQTFHMTKISKVEPVEPSSQISTGNIKSLRKQSSFECHRSSSLDKKTQLTRKPWGSPSRPSTPPLTKVSGSPSRRPPASPAKAPRAPLKERYAAPPESNLKPTSGIPKPIIEQALRPGEKVELLNRNDSSPTPNQAPKSKKIRPKIITSYRSTQAKRHPPDVNYNTNSTLSTKVILCPSRVPLKNRKVANETKSSSASNQLHDVAKGWYHNPDLIVSGIRPQGQTLPHKPPLKLSDSTEELPGKCIQLRTLGILGTEGAGPQLGLVAVTRLPPRARMLLGGPQLEPLDRGASLPTHCPSHSSDQRKLVSDGPPRSLLPQPGQSGLRPPGFTRLPLNRLSAFGFVRSASVSSVSSIQSAENVTNGQSKLTQSLGSVVDELRIQGSSLPPSEAQPRGPNRSLPIGRRNLPPHCGSPIFGRKEFQKEAEVTHSTPKRFANDLSRSHSPAIQAWQRATLSHCGSRGPSPQRGVQEVDRQLMEQLMKCCENQTQHLYRLQEKLSRALLALEAFAITTQFFSQKSDNAIVREAELSLELVRIRDEVASNVLRWEGLRQDKENLERHFQQKLQQLQVLQKKELGALEEKLNSQHAAEKDRLWAEQRSQLEKLQSLQQQKIQEINMNHNTTLATVESEHQVAMAMLNEGHGKTIQSLKLAHEHQKKSLEIEFEKLRLSLQDQIDTLTFQNRSLRDRAKRFEEALRRSTDEQILDALAPYQHIEEDLKSLKEVLEMKNQHIHKQELKIAELETMVQKNVILEERVQVLQQQNEDLQARIDKNMAMSRQLSEENANLHVFVEKESNEKKRLSRTNEELLWRLQTGDLSPNMSPTSSPIHKGSAGPGSPARYQPFPR